MELFIAHASDRDAEGGFSATLCAEIGDDFQADLAAYQIKYMRRQT